MRISSVTIHNFRAIEHACISLNDYTLLIGENNAGKTGILTALRVFYEDGGAKFDRKVDLPKFETADQESWVELTFETTADEQEALKGEYGRQVQGHLSAHRLKKLASKQ